MNNQYVIKFPLSYGDFLKANGLTEIGDDQLEKWEKSIIDKYQYDLTTSPEEIMNFFKIPITDENLQVIKNRNFKINSEINMHDTERKVVMYSYILNFGSDIILS